MSLKEQSEPFTEKGDVINWFGDRGYSLSPEEIECWYWDKSTYQLYYIFTESSELYQPVETGYIDYCYTHRENGSSIFSFEPYGVASLETIEHLLKK